MHHLSCGDSYKIFYLPEEIAGLFIAKNIAIGVLEVAKDFMNVLHDSVEFIAFQTAKSVLTALEELGDAVLDAAK